MQEEIWKDIPEYEGLYQASNLGNIKSLNYNKTQNSKILKQSTSKIGYKRVQLWKNNKGISFLVHRLVALTFFNDYNENLQVNHKDGNKANNTITNLEMVTAKENQLHSYHVLKTKPSMKGHFGANHVRSRKVNQYDKQRNYIKTWNSLIEASNELNISACSISNACSNRRTSAGGFVWEYADK